MTQLVLDNRPEMKDKYWQTAVSAGAKNYKENLIAALVLRAADIAGNYVDREQSIRSKKERFSSPEENLRPTIGGSISTQAK